MNMNKMIGETFGRLTVLSEDEEKSSSNKKYYICKCSCGNIKSVRQDRLSSGITLSCGCLNKELAAERSRSRASDLTGQTINNFDVLEYDHSDSYRHYKCKCKLCGNIVVLPSKLIKQYNSCGCLSAEALERCQRENAKAVKRMMTNPAIVNKTDANKNSKTGVRGVFFKKSEGKFIATIQFRKCNKMLGRYSTIEEATKARKKAELIRKDALKDLLNFEEEIKKEMERGGFLESEQ